MNTALHSLKVTQTQLTLPSGRWLWKRSSLSVYRSLWASLPAGLTFYPSSCCLNCNPLHSSTAGLIAFSSTCDPWTSQVPPTQEAVTGDVENTVIHPYFVRLPEKWKCDISSEYDSFTDAASTTGRLEWITPLRADRSWWHHELTRHFALYGTHLAVLYKCDSLTGSGRKCTVTNSAANKSHIAANYLSATSTLNAGILIMKSWVRSVWESVTVKKRLHHQLKGLLFMLYTFSI